MIEQRQNIPIFALRWSITAGPVTYNTSLHIYLLIFLTEVLLFVMNVQV